MLLLATVLLQAFCYEHGIYIIKVDSGRKLAHVLGTLNANETCVLIRKTIINRTKHAVEEEGCDNNDTAAVATSSTKDTETQAVEVATVAASATVSTTAFCSKEEDILVNFCENSWHNSDYCIVKLPES